jgi:hypothetical protein
LPGYRPQTRPADPAARALQRKKNAYMRKKISTDELHALLETQFRKTAAGLCGKCAVPRPVFMQAAEGRSNWRVGRLDECGDLCHTILEDIAAQLAQRYDLGG